MRILVFGAGAIGSVLGGFLAKAGHEVTFLGRPWHIDAIRQHGLTITGLWGNHTIRHLGTAASLDDITRDPAFDWIFVCVKAHQTAEAASALPALLGRQTLVCAFQNGLGNYETLIQQVPSSRVALGRVIFGVEIEPGRVHVTVCADDVLIGATDEHFPSQSLTELAAALKTSGIPSRVTSTILVVLWSKVLYNCALNGLSTLLEVPYGKLLEQRVTRQMMQSVIEEAYRVTAAHRITLEPSTAQAYCALLFERLIPTTAVHRSSMLQDVRRGKPTEIDAMNGALVRLATQAGLAAPINALVTRLVHAKEQFFGMSSSGLRTISW